MHRMRTIAGGELVARILRHRLVSQLPLRLAGQAEWYEFTPLAFLLVQSLRPERILEVGTTIGDSYLCLCQAVRECNLGAVCISVPDWHVTAGGSELSKEFQEFRSYDDQLYGSFSRIQVDERLLVADDQYNFNLIHIIAPASAEELDLVCRNYLPILNPSGVALISGLDRIREGSLETVIARHCSYCSSRIVQIYHRIAILSKQPIGVARALLCSSPEEFDLARTLFRTLGDRVRSHAELLREESLHRCDVGRLSSEVDRLEKRDRSLQDELEQLRTRTKVETDTFATQIAELRDSDVDANIRFGRADLLLGRTWAENQQLRRELAVIKGDKTPAGDRRRPEDSTGVEGRFAETANRLLFQLYDSYVGKELPRNLSGKELWDECGRSVLTAVLSQEAPLRFRISTHPKISVVLVLRNKAHLSILALCALLLDTSDYEVIVVDNASSDETPAMLARIEGMKVIRNAENRGFGSAVMQALPAASGEFLCLLNNDALLQPGALARVVASFSERPGTGAVGGKVLLADGRLQEAGCIIWRDGRSVQYGRGEDPGLPQYSFRRPVDYCSGVFLVTPTELFFELGGLDRQYATAYYEDADYCMKVWHAGRSVIYEPRAVVQHYEAAASPNQLAALDLFIPNHHKFTEKWRRALRRHQPERPDNIVKARTAACSGASIQLYIVDTTGMALLQSELRKESQQSDRSTVATVMYAGTATVEADIGGFDVDVERRNLDTMPPDEIKAYLSASDSISILAEQASLQAILPSLEAYANKVTYTNRSLASIGLDDRKAT